MSEDLRNSIYLWVGGIALALLSWTCLRFDLLKVIPVEWVQGALIVMLGLNILQSLYFFLRRRLKTQANVDG